MGGHQFSKNFSSLSSFEQAVSIYPITQVPHVSNMPMVSSASSGVMFAVLDDIGIKLNTHDTVRTAAWWLEQ